jgi:hypothetical protein
MLNVRDHISPTIAEQFPALYREEGDVLVEFVKAYYEYNDSIMDRNIPKLRDVDTTLASFLIFFKKKYLQSLPLDTVVDTRFIIKHIQDLYKRKGSEESLRLLFRMFFDEEIEVFYPSTAILKPSDSIWGGAIYLELKPVNTVDDYPIQRGDKLQGDVSGASAFVDNIIFVNFSGTISPIAYLSNVSGTFISDDAITVTRAGVSHAHGKLVLGSISENVIQNASRSPGQVLGDKVKLVSTASGSSATGTISEVSTTTSGTIDFIKEDGGFGYVIEPPEDVNDVSISNQALIVAGTTTIDSIKPGQHIEVDAGSSYTVDPITGAVGAGTGTISGAGKVVAYNHPLLYVRTNRQDPTPVSTPHTKAEFLSFVSAQFALIAAGNSTANKKMLAILNIDTEDTAYRLGDISNSGYDFITSRYITLDDSDIFALYVAGTLTNTAHINWIEDRLLPAIYAQGFGYKFDALPASEFVDITIGSNTSVRISTIAGYNATANFEVANIDNTEQVRVITDFIGDFADKPLAVIINATAMQNPGIYEIETLGTTNFTNFGAADNNIGTRFTASGPATGTGTVTDVVATNYGMSGTLIVEDFNAETLNTRIKDAFNSKQIKIGSIASINVTSSGSDFVNDVFSEIEYLDVARFDKRDTILTFANPDFLIEVGQIVTQVVRIEDPSFETDDLVDYTAKGRFLKRDGNDFYFRQLSFYDFDEAFSISVSNNSYVLTNVRPDMTSLPMGRNAVITGDASYLEGQIERVDVTNTGYRYKDNEEVIIRNSSGKDVATAIVRTLGPGKTEGKWSSSTSFLSDSTKYLHDNDYYQEYSYDISTVIDPEKYTQLIKDTVGVAGTKVFSSPLINSNSNLNSTLDVEFQIWDLTSEDYVTEGSEEDMMTEGGSSENLITEIVGLDLAASNVVTSSIGT